MDTPSSSDGTKRHRNDGDDTGADALATALSGFKRQEVIKDTDPGFRVVVGDMGGVRTLLKTRRVDAEVPIPPEENLPWQLSSESGAEYSYYSARVSARVSTDYSVEVISPASDAKIERERPQATAYFAETYSLYSSVVAPLIEVGLAKDEAKLRQKQRILASEHVRSRVGWIHNVLSGAKEVERMLYSDDTMLLNVDTKWSSHPDCSNTPREHWLGHPSTDHLYCLGYVRDTSLPTIRELRAQHIPMLRAIRDRGCATIDRIYGVKANQLRIFFHYHPQFYHLHIHFTRAHVNPGDDLLICVCLLLKAFSTCPAPIAIT